MIRNKDYMKKKWTVNDQIKLAEEYLKAYNKTAFIQLGLLGDPISFMQGQLTEIKKLIRRSGKRT